METDRPWERWECSNGGHDWESFEFNHPAWSLDFQYRRKPATITINGIEVPEPMREAPDMGSLYWLVTNLSDDPVELPWLDDMDDRKWLAAGLIHATQEAAEANRQALLSLTRKPTQ